MRHFEPVIEWETALHKTRGIPRDDHVPDQTGRDQSKQASFVGPEKKKQLLVLKKNYDDADNRLGRKGHLLGDETEVCHRIT